MNVAKAQRIELENRSSALEEMLKAATEDAQTAKAELKELKAAHEVVLKSKGVPISPSTSSKKEEKLRQKKERLMAANARLEKTSVPSLPLKTL